MSFFSLGTVKVPHKKNTATMAPVRMTPPSEVVIPVSMHIGAPSVPTVRPGDPVRVGTLIAEAGGYVGAPIHSPVSGTVKKMDTVLVANGRSVPAIVIESDGEMTPDDTLTPPVLNTLDDFIAAVRASGLVGLGGAGFPAAVKFDAEKKGLIDTVVINGAECEPYITSDTRTMIDDLGDVRDGVLLLERFLRAGRILFGVEKNKPGCIANLENTFRDDAKVAVVPLPETYPQGGEKILIYNTTRRIVPEGKLPADVGVLVLNVTSLAFLGRYARTGMPLVEKCVTVDGSAIAHPQNVIVPVGTKISDVISFVGGFSEEPGKVLYGGPMMGIAVWSLDAPVLKNTNAVIALNKKDSETPKPLPCIHCGRCVSHCPMGLNPTAFIRALSFAPKDRAEQLEAAKIGLCMECGCCSYVCPSKRPLVESNRLAKADLRDYKAHQKTPDGGKGA